MFRFVKTFTLISAFVLINIFGVHDAYAQATVIPDSSFVLGTGFSGLGNPVDIILQPDGKVLVPMSGAAPMYNGVAIPNIIRLNTDGTVDTGFTPGTGFSTNGIRHVNRMSDGKFMVGGTFTSYNGTSINRIARLNADGTLDTGFAVGTGLNSTVYPVTPQSDGKVITSGFFTTYNGTAVPRIIRINTDGTLDTTFNSGGANANNWAWFIAAQPDDKLIVSGPFTTYNGNTVNRIMRLNADGTLDTTFNTNTGSGLNNQAQHIYIYPNGKILLGGQFTTFNGTSINRLVRLNADGTLDTTFNIGSGFNNTVQSMLIEPNGRIIVGGDFTTFNGTTANRIVRLYADGTLDTTFNTGTGFDNNVYMNLLRQTDGKIIVPGNFLNFNGTSAQHLVRFTVIDTTAPVITPVTISSNNTNPLYATTGNTITLAFSVDDALTASTITIGGQTVTPVCNDTGLATTPCTATFTVTNNLPVLDGVVPISISATSAGGSTGPITATTNGSSVTIDRTAPIVSAITISSNNTVSKAYALNGDTVTLTFAVNDPVVSSTVTIGGQTVTPVCNPVGSQTVCIATLPITQSIPTQEGLINWNISVTSVGGTTTGITRTSDGSVVTIDRSGTSFISSGSSSGTYIPTSGGKITPTPVVITPTTPTTLPTTGTGTTYISPVDGTTKECRPFTTYLKIGKKNDTSEVKLWQSFLNKHMGEKLTVSGIYNKTTESAIKRFQSKYSDEILKPWGLTKPTGYTYQSTRAQGNKILGCSEGSVTLDNGVVIK